MWAQLVAVWAAFGIVIVLQLLALVHFFLFKHYRDSRDVANGLAIIIVLVLALAATGAVGLIVTEDIMQGGVCL